MNDATYATVRAAMTTRALSTMGQCPAWDAAVSDFLRLQALSLSNDAFGPYNAANEAYDRATMQTEAKFGRGWREIPEAAETMAVAFAAIRKAEAEQADNFLTPLWAAERKLANTPAPTLNAALFKAELMEWEEVWNDCKLERSGFEIVAEELARFAGDQQ